MPGGSRCGRSAWWRRASRRAVQVVAGLPVAVLGLAVAALGLASCGGSAHRVLDPTSAGRQISQGLASSYHVAPPVSCPREVPVTPGRKFTCTTKLDGQPLALDATLVGQSGQFTIAARQAVLVVADAQSVLASDVTKEAGAPTNVVCATSGRTILVLPVGATLACTASQGASTRGLTVTVTDLKGDVTYSLDPPSNGPGASAGRS